MTAATLNDVEIRRALVGSFHAGLERCQPYALTARIYRRNVRRSSIAAGKAAHPMLQAAEDAYQGSTGWP